MREAAFLLFPINIFFFCAQHNNTMCYIWKCMQGFLQKNAGIILVPLWQLQNASCLKLQSHVKLEHVWFAFIFFSFFADNIITLEEKVFENCEKWEAIHGILGLQKIFRKLFHAPQWTPWPLPPYVSLQGIRPGMRIPCSACMWTSEDLAEGEVECFRREVQD